MRFFFYSIICLSLASCSAKLTPFTQRMYNEFNWTDSELQRIQFYLSDDIVLWRDAGREETVIKNGKIRVKDGRKIEEIIFKKGTPGVMIFSPKENRFAVSFVEDNDQFLMFGPNPKVNNRYVLLGKKWNRDYGEVTYDGKIYQTTARSAFTTLLVDINEANLVKHETSTVKGRKVK